MLCWHFTLIVEYNLAHPPDSGNHGQKQVSGDQGNHTNQNNTDSARQGNNQMYTVCSLSLPCDGLGGIQFSLWSIKFRGHTKMSTFSWVHNTYTFGRGSVAKNVDSHTLSIFSTHFYHFHIIFFALKKCRYVHFLKGFWKVCFLYIWKCWHFGQPLNRLLKKVRI